MEKTHSYPPQLGGTQKHIPRINLCFKETEITSLVFLECFHGHQELSSQDTIPTLWSDRWHLSSDLNDLNYLGKEMVVQGPKVRRQRQSVWKMWRTTVRLWVKMLIDVNTLSAIAMEYEFLKVKYKCTHLCEVPTHLINSIR